MENVKQEILTNFIAPKIFYHLMTKKQISVEAVLNSLDPNKNLQAIYEIQNLGASDSLFMVSHDKKFLLKTISKQEFYFLYELLHSYHQHLIKSEKSLISVFVGLYSIKFQHKETQYLVLIQNICEGSYLYKFDLKGSKRATVKDFNSVQQLVKSEIYKEDDFLHYIQKLRLPWSEYQYLLPQIKSDIEFLQRFNIFDYSFLLFVCNDGYKFGIIDYTALFTFRRHVELFWKKYIQRQKNPSVLSPQNYANRFYTFLENIFVFVDQQGQEVNESLMPKGV